MGENTSLIYRKERVDIGVRVVFWEEPRAPNFYYAFRGRPHFSRLQLESFQGGRKKRVNKVVLHHDGNRSSAGCFATLRGRNLSTHLMIDANGTVYQPLDLGDIAFHAAGVNLESVGIDLNNPVKPERVNEDSSRQIYRGKINGGTTVSLGYTEPQYESLIAVLVGLFRIFPNLRRLAPVGVDGRVLRQKLTNVDFAGVVGHFHVSAAKWDPGPGFDWERVLIGIRGARLYFPITLPGVPNLAHVPKRRALAEAEAYFRLTESGDGGYFPIGLGQTWHTGVHLYAERGTPVLAPADGKVVVARQVEPDRMGNSNTVVIKHELDVDGTPTPAFSVLSHLAQEELGRKSKVPWIRRLFLRDDGPAHLPPDDDADFPGSAPGAIAMRAGRTALIEVDVKAGELVGHTGAFTGDLSRSEPVPLLDFALISGKPLVARDDTNFEIVDEDDGDDVLCNARAVWKRITTEPEALRGLAEGGYPLAPSEIREFFDEGRGAAELRWLVVKHATEWSDETDFSGIFGAGIDFEWHTRHLAKRYIARIRPYLWWDERVTAHTGLPKSRKIFAHHPITLLAVMAQNEARKALRPGDEGPETALEGDDLKRARARDYEAEKDEMGVHTACSLDPNADALGGAELDEAEEVDPEQEGWMRWEQGEWEPE